MIYLLPALLALGYLAYYLGNNPEAIEIDDKMKAARDEHLRMAYRHGIRL
jgi:hypothetical protein